MTVRSEEAILVDTSVLSVLLKPKDTRAKLYRPHLQGKILAISFVTMGELYRWAYQRRWGEQRLRQLEELLTRKLVLVPFDETVAQYWARIPIDNPRANLGDNDAWIAACALRYDLTLVTDDAAFERVRGLRVIRHQHT